MADFALHACVQPVGLEPLGVAEYGREQSGYLDAQSGSQRSPSGYPKNISKHKKIYAANSYVDFCCLGDMFLI